MAMWQYLLTAAVYRNSPVHGDPNGKLSLLCNLPCCEKFAGPICNAQYLLCRRYTDAEGKTAHGASFQNKRTANGTHPMHRRVPLYGTEQSLEIFKCPEGYCHPACSASLGRGWGACSCSYFQGCMDPERWAVGKGEREKERNSSRSKLAPR